MHTKTSTFYANELNCRRRTITRTPHDATFGPLQPKRQTRYLAHDVEITKTKLTSLCRVTGARSREAGFPPEAAQSATAHCPGAHPEPPAISERYRYARSGSRLHRRSESARTAGVDDGSSRLSRPANSQRHGSDERVAAERPAAAARSAAPRHVARLRGRGAGTAGCTSRVSGRSHRCADISAPSRAHRGGAPPRRQRR